jgi:hypothetical protein
MTSGDAIQIPRAWTPYLWWAFVLIIVGVVCSEIVSIYEMRNTQTKVELIEDRALASIELVFNFVTRHRPVATSFRRPYR